MLKVQINKGGSVPFNCRVAAKDFCGDDFLDNGKFIGDLEISGEVVNDGSKSEVRGKINCRKEFICDRCLSEAAENQQIDFAEEIDGADVVDGLFDMTELVRDTLIASQPIQNLCRADCKGLCPVCGKNLNDGVCDCERISVDPRLAPLIDFKSIEEV